MSFVAPEIHNTSIVYPKNIVSSARPPHRRSNTSCPMFAWGGTVTINPSFADQGNMLARLHAATVVVVGRRRAAGGHRVAAAELFQVDPPERLKPLVTMFGFDPVFKSDVTATRPTHDLLPARHSPSTARQSTTPTSGSRCWRRATSSTSRRTTCDYDPERDLWFCDIAVNPGNNERSYMPFVRLALARYQPHSLPGVHLSRVVLADFIQLSPDRAVSVIGTSPTSRTVTVLGRGYTATEFRNQPGVVRVTVELARAGVTDPNLKWATAAIRNYNPVTTLTPNVALGNFVTWSGSVALPNTTAAKRLVIEEIELHRDGFEYIANNPILPGTAERVVFTDTIKIS